MQAQLFKFGGGKVLKYINGQYKKMTAEEITNLTKQNADVTLIQPDSEIDQIRQQITDLQLALTELYEGGLTNG